MFNCTHVFLFNFCRQETPLDCDMQKKGPDGLPVGCRVYGDCDIFMKEMMRHIFPSENLDVWEKGRSDRMKTYDSERVLV